MSESKAVGRRCKQLKPLCDKYNAAHAGGGVRVALSDAGGTVGLVALVQHGEDEEYLVSFEFSATNPFGAPVVKFLTPNHVFEVGKSVCLEGFTHYHPDSWTATHLNFDLLIDAVVAPLLDDACMKDVAHAVGALPKLARSTAQPKRRAGSQAYNREHHAGMVEMFA